MGSFIDRGALYTALWGYLRVKFFHTFAFAPGTSVPGPSLVLTQGARSRSRLIAFSRGWAWRPANLRREGGGQKTRSSGPPARLRQSGGSVRARLSYWAKLGSRQAPFGACRSRKRIRKLKKTKKTRRAGGSVQDRLAPEATM